MSGYINVATWAPCCDAKGAEHLRLGNEEAVLSSTSNNQTEQLLPLVRGLNLF